MIVDIFDGDDVEDFDEEDEPCPCGFDDGGSHYHCANCGGVSSMMGHYDFEEGIFDCPVSPFGVLEDAICEIPE